MSSWSLITGEMEAELAKLAPGSVDAIVTSPPYADQRARDEDGGYVDAARMTEPANRNGRKPGVKNQSRKQRREAPMRFVEWFMPKLDAMVPVLAPRGSLMLNLGVVLRGGEESPYADEILRLARESGWKLLHRQVWHKPNGNCLSDRRFLTISHEWVFWLARTTDAFRGYVDTEEGYDPHSRSPHDPDSVRRIAGPYIRDTTDERYAKRSGRNQLHPDGARPTTVIRAGVGGVKGLNHPAVMALPLADDLVRRACPLGGLVLDPFAGSGTTLIAATNAGRRALGVELNPSFADEARERIRDHAPLLNGDVASAEPTHHQEALIG